MFKKIIALTIGNYIKEADAEFQKDLIHNLISRIAQFYNNKRTIYAQNKALHIKYCLTALLCLEIENFQFLYQGLKQKNCTYEDYVKSLQPVLKIYRALAPKEKQLLAYATLFHDIYYRIADTYEAYHGPLGADYLAKNKDFFKPFNLSAAEIKSIIELTRCHGYIWDFGRYVFPEELKVDLANKNLLLLLDFLDSAGKLATDKHLNGMTIKENTSLLQRFNEVEKFKNSRESFYLFRLKHLFCPGNMQEISDQEFKSFFAQLNKDPQAAEIKEFLNKKLKVDDFNIFKRGFDFLPLLPNGAKDYRPYLEIFKKLMKIAKDWPVKYVSLDSKDYKNDLQDISLEAIRSFLEKVKNKAPNEQLFSFDKDKGKIYIKYE